MIPFRLDGDDAKQDGPFKAIIDGALGKLSILTEAPTQDENSVSEGEGAYYNNKIYFKLGGVLKEFSVTSTA